MKKFKRIIAIFFMFIALLSITPLQVNAEWRQASNGWWYAQEGTYATGWKQIDGQWYYFDSNGYMNTGWEQIGGQWYYFDSNGHMNTGWINDNGNWYYTYSDGAMAHDCYIESYYLNSSGAWTTNINGDTLNSNAYSSTNTDDGTKKILIAYFSRTGTTEEAANKIQELTKGDIVEIKTVTPYTSSYQELSEVAKKESDENSRPELATKVDNMDDYDVIFVGYPIWWHKAPMVIDTFLESYDLSGKTIVPFCTSAGSDIEESMGAINTLCDKSNILEGLAANNISNIEPWLKKIGIIE